VSAVVVVVVVVLAGGVVVVGRVGTVAGGGVVVGTGCVGTVVVVGGGVVGVVVVTVTVKRDPPVSFAPFGLTHEPTIAYVPGLASAGAVATTLPAPVAPAGGPLAGVTVTEGGATAASADTGAPMPTQSASNVTVRTSLRIVPIHCGAFGPNGACRR
jgi:hypothetical protein